MHRSASIRHRLPARALTLSLAVVPVLALSACGGDSVPSNAVAKVDDAVIEKRTFDRWMRIAAISATGPTQQGAGAPEVNIPQPPEFTECVQQKRTSAPKPAKGQPQPSETDFKAQCQQEYEGLRDQVMQLLIQNEWVTREAEQQGVEVTDAEVRKAFEDQKKQSFPKEKDYQEFLKTSGFTEEDVLFRVRLETLSNKLREKVTEGKDQVSDQQVRDYYEKNKQRFAQPERRDLRLVLTKDRSRAEEAKSALEGGDSWKSVAKELSVDQASKNQGGQLLAVTEGQQEPALSKAVFDAERGELTGPIKTQFGWYVFQVQKVTAADQQTLEEATQTIKGILASENQQKALDTFIKDFQEEWKDKTDCREGYVTQDCSNAPEQETGTTEAAPPGAAPAAPQTPQTPQAPGAPGAPQAPQTPPVPQETP